MWHIVTTWHNVKEVCDCERVEEGDEASIMQLEKKERKMTMPKIRRRSCKKNDPLHVQYLVNGSIIFSVLV